ncbi:MAG: helix-hairpin-helix domain-containing protein [Clostridia bacterium]|nr:helix-hairpin-helix domain-containing protein [Clostridia bacterium]
MLMHFEAGVIVMIVFKKGKQVYIFVAILIITIAVATVIERFGDKTFTEEIMTEAIPKLNTGQSGINDDGKININTATVNELAMLYGIGEKTAQRIIDYRNAHGAFSQIEGIMLVPGIGEGLFESIKNDICVE